MDKEQTTVMGCRKIDSYVIVVDGKHTPIEILDSTSPQPDKRYWAALIFDEENGEMAAGGSMIEVRDRLIAKLRAGGHVVSIPDVQWKRDWKFTEQEEEWIRERLDGWPPIQPKGLDKRFNP